MKKYYILGTGYKNDDVSKSYPYEVWLDMQEPKFPIVMLEGKGSGGVGGNFKLEEILQDHWKEHLEISQTKWLLPMCGKNPLSTEDFLKEYQRVHGYMPELKQL